jgi:hypothetical protein
MVWSRQSWSNVKRIYIRPAEERFTNYDPSTLYTEFDGDVIKQLLGDDWYRVVDLRDAAEVERVADVLYGGEISGNVADTLRLMHETLRDLKLDEESERTWWHSVQGLAQRDWLRANFAVEGQPAIGYDAKNWAPFQKWDLQNPWIRDTLKRMPQLVPAFILVKSDMPPRWLTSDEDDDDDDFDEDDMYADISDILGNPYPHFQAFFDDDFDDNDDMDSEDEDEDVLGDTEDGEQFDSATEEGDGSRHPGEGGGAGQGRQSDLGDEDETDAEW